MGVASPPAPGALRWFLLLGAILTPFNYFGGIPVGEITLHPLQLWAILLVMLMLVLSPRTILDAADAPPLLLWTTFAFVAASTVFGTPEEYRLRGFLDVSLLAINLAAFTLAYGQWRSDPAGWASCARVLYAASLLSSGILVVRALLLARSGVFVLPDSHMLGLGTVIGTYTAAFAAASVAGMIFARTGRLRLWMAAGIFVHGMAASLALARGPWVAGALAIVATLALAVGFLPGVKAVAGAVGRAVVALVLLASSVVSAVLVNPTVGLLIVSRAVQITDLGGGTGRARLILFQALWNDAQDSPVFGHGAATYRRVSELLQVQGSISENFLLEMLHAGGAMAALPLALAAAIVIVRVTRAVGAPTGMGLAPACLAGALALMLGALTNPAAWDTAFWILTAVAAAFGAATLRPSAQPLPQVV